MPVTMEQVINELDREEPEYQQAAQLGPEALPHLITLIQGDNLNIGVVALCDTPAGGALPTGCFGSCTVQRLCQVKCQHHLAYVRRAREKVSMGMSSSLEAMLKVGYRPELSDQLPHPSHS